MSITVEIYEIYRYNCHMLKKYSKLIKIIRRVLFILCFTAVAIVVLISAAGLRIELKGKKIVQTSLIVASSQPIDAKFWFDGEARDGRSPWRVSGVMAGVHELKVTKDGYNSWAKTINVMPGETALIDEPILFLSQPEHVSLDSEDQNGLLTKLNKLDQTDDLIVKSDTELWWRGQLVTRMSSPIFQPRMYQDDRHISFISDGGLHLIDIDGSNVYSPVKLSENEGYIFINKGTTLVYKIGDKISALRIR